MTNIRTKRKADVVILIQKVMASVYSSALQQFSGLGRPKPESLRGRQNSKETLWYRRFFWSHLDISIKSSANRQEIYIHQIKSNIHLWHKQKIADLSHFFPRKDSRNSRLPHRRGDVSCQAAIKSTGQFFRKRRVLLLFPSQLHECYD